jgi:cytochrome c556
MSRSLAPLLVGFQIALLCTNSAWAEVTPENQIKYRQAVMTAMKGHITAISMMALDQVEDQGFLQQHADALAEASAELKTVFQAGSGGEDTHALDAIWEEPERFAEALEAAEQATDALRAAAASGDGKAVVNAFKETGDTCKACHESFRAETAE